MRHLVAGKKLGRTPAHRAAMARNLAVSLIEHERVVTTLPKAKNVKPIIEKLITLAKVPTQHHRRLAFARLRSKSATSKLFAVLGPRFFARKGGYCRILKLNRNRLGDNGERALLELVERTPKAEPSAAPAPATRAARSKATPQGTPKVSPKA
jgi:large subunit ribosomal protein L17